MVFRFWLKKGGNIILYNSYITAEYGKTKTVILAFSFLTIFYFTTHIMVEMLYGKNPYFLLLLFFCDIFVSMITALIVSRTLKREQYVPYGVIFSALYILLMVSAYIFFRTAAYSQVFSEKYWIYFPSLLSVVHMPIAVGGHLFILYVLSKRKWKHGRRSAAIMRWSTAPGRRRWRYPEGSVTQELTSLSWWPRNFTVMPVGKFLKW